MYKHRVFRLIVLVVGILIVTKAPSSQATASDSFYTVPTHPHFWPLTTADGLKNYTGKHFAHDRLTPSAYPQFSGDLGDLTVWVWSGPWVKDNRKVLYDYSRTDCMVNCEQPTTREWEQWKQIDNYSAQYLQSGGNSNKNAPLSYLTTSDCRNGNNPGVYWPDLQPGISTQISTNSNKRSKCTDVGYNGIIRNTPPNRTSFCNQQLISFNIARQICLAAPSVDVIYQVYQDGPGLEGGCEATIYAYGYPMPAATEANNSVAVKNWFRNGELKWSRWVSVKNPPPVYKIDWQWWKNQCAPLLTAAPNFAYTGMYKLNTSFYQDNGDNDLAVRQCSDSASPVPAGEEEKLLPSPVATRDKGSAEGGLPQERVIPSASLPCRPS